MNDSNIITQIFAWIATFSSFVGLAVQEMIFIIFGAIGLLISSASFIHGRVDARNKRKEDKRRTKIIEDYLNDNNGKSKKERYEAVNSVTEALRKGGQ